MRERHPLPWTADEVGNIFDANGRHIADAADADVTATILAWATPAPTPPRGTGEESPASPLADEVARLRSELTAANVRLAAVEGERDRDWILALGYAVGMDSGFMVPIVPKVEPCKQLFDAIRTESYDRGHGDGYACAIQLRDAASERRGAERALRWAWQNEGAVCTEPEDELLRLALATLFPPPGAEVGRG